jgi:antitoxin component YwqK of YwqJK toxin-antitoxin module
MRAKIGLFFLAAQRHSKIFRMWRRENGKLVSEDVLYERSFSRDGIMYSLAKYSIDSSTGRKIRKREWEKRYDEHGRLYSLKTHTDTSGTDTYYFSNGCIERQVLLRHLKGFEATNCDEFIGDEFKMDSLIHSYKTNSDRFLKDTTYSYYNIHPSGVWKSYFSNCALEFMGEYADYYVMCSMTDEFGYSYAIVLVETGHWVYFDPDGKKYKEEIWDYGKLVECIDF